MDDLNKLMGGHARIKVLRLFFFNPEEVFGKEAIMSRLKLSSAHAQKEIGFLTRVGVVRKKSTFKEVTNHRTGKTAKKRINGWMLNADFPYRAPLEQFLVETAVIDGKEIANRLRPIGKLRLVIVSGIFMRLWDSRIDMLIVGEEINPDSLANVIKYMEAELGHELRYAALTTQDFYYRRSVQDKLIRDVLDYPHEMVIDRIGV